MWLDVGLRTDNKNTYVQNKLHFVLKIYARCSRLNSQRDCGDVHDHLMSTRIFTLMMNEDINVIFKNRKANNYWCDLDLQMISQRLHVSYHTRSGRNEKSIQITHVYFMHGCNRPGRHGSKLVCYSHTFRGWNVGQRYIVLVLGYMLVLSMPTLTIPCSWNIQNKAGFKVQGTSL